MSKERKSAELRAKDAGNSFSEGMDCLFSVDHHVSALLIEVGRSLGSQDYQKNPESTEIVNNSDSKDVIMN